MLTHLIPGNILTYRWREGAAGLPHRIYSVDFASEITYIAEVNDMDDQEFDGPQFEYRIFQFRMERWSA